MPQPYSNPLGGPTALEAARRRLRELRASWDYAFAMGHGCSIGCDPRFAAVRREAADLAALIAEHTPVEHAPAEPAG